MTSDASTLPWIEIAAAIVVGGMLLLLVVGLLLVRRPHRRGEPRPMGLIWNRLEASFHGARMFVEVDHLDPQNALPIQAVVQRGWSPELVRDVLGRPDYAVLDPRRKQEPLRFYDRARVERAERGKKFRQHRAKVANEQARSEARLRKWVELRQHEGEEAEPARHEG